MIKGNLAGPALLVVAIRALLALLATVYIMAAVTIDTMHTQFFLVDVTRMAIRAGNLFVFSLEGEIRLVVAEGGLLPAFGRMAGLALATVLPLVFIVQPMTGIAVRLEWSTLGLWLRCIAMALFTGHLLMPSGQAIIRVLVMIKILRRPAIDIVAVLAFLTIFTTVHVIAAVAADAGLGDGAIGLLRVAISACHPFVLAT